MEEWEAAAPHPTRYAYRPSLKPHSFMGLSKFDAGRLHQMRSGKSYLRAHPSWDDDGPTTCPKCHEAPKAFEHAILHCSAKRHARTRHLSGGLRARPRRPRLVIRRPPARTHQLYQVYGHSLPPGDVFSPFFLRRLRLLPLI